MYCYTQYGWWKPQWCVVFNHQHKSSATDPAQTSRLLRGLLLLLHLAAAWPKAVIIPLRRVYIVWYSQLVGGLKHVLCFHILGIVIPTDFHIFQRGWNHQPVLCGFMGHPGYWPATKLVWDMWVQNSMTGGDVFSSVGHPFSIGDGPSFSKAAMFRAHGPPRKGQWTPTKVVVN